MMIISTLLSLNAVPRELCANGAWALEERGKEEKNVFLCDYILLRATPSRRSAKRSGSWSRQIKLTRTVKHPRAPLEEFNRSIQAN
jgi:hypothetical protein